MDLQRIIYLVKETKEIITNREMAAHVKEKGVADYVTQVDVAVQNFLKEELYKVLIYISTLENHRKAGVGKSPNQSFLFI